MISSGFFITNCSVNKLHAILPSNYDRFNAPVEPPYDGSPSPTEQSWVKLNAPSTTKESADDSSETDSLTTDEENQTTVSKKEIHPEGSFFWFAGHTASNCPVTEDLRALSSWLIELAGFKSDDQRVSVFLMLEEHKLKYYLVDHAAKKVFWIKGHLPAEVTGSETHKAQNMLCEEYWIHMENFPLPTAFFVDDLLSLKIVLGSLAIDSSTSDGSTSPFSATQIQQFQNNLNAFSGEPDIVQTYAIARLWCMIWHTRVVNNYGTLKACLDRFVVLSDNPPAFTGVLASLARLTVGGGAEAHLMRCSRAWAGRIAYVIEWNSFKSKNEREWTRVMYLSCVLVIASLLLGSQSNSKWVSTVPLVLACASAASGYHLLTESQNLGDQAADASTYFQKWETVQYGVQGLALRNAFPQTILTWAFMTFILSYLTSVIL